MEARRVLVGRGPASRAGVWRQQSTVVVAVWLCLAAVVGRGAAFSGLVGLAPALVLGSMSLCEAASRCREQSVSGATGLSTALAGWVVTGVRLPWWVGLAAAAGFASAGTARSTEAVVMLLLLLSTTAGRVAPTWRPVLVGVLCAGFALLAQPGLPVLRLSAAAVLQAGLGAAMAASAVRAVAEASHVEPQGQGPWGVVAGAWLAGACGAAAGDVGGGAVSSALVAGFTIWVADGPGLGALVGAVAGLVCLPAYPAGAFAPAAAAVAGAAAGLCRPYRARLAPVSYAAATLALGAISVPPDWSWCLGATAASAAWLAAGSWVLRPFVGRHPDTVPMATPVYRPSVEDRLRIAAATCLELSRGLAEVPLDGGGDQADERGLRIAEEVCPGCPALTACWVRKLPRARRMVAGLWKQAHAAPVSWQDVGGPDTIFCFRPREMAEAANRHAALSRQRDDFARLMEASRRSAITPLIGIGRVLADIAEEVAAAGEPLRQRTGPAPRSADPLEERWSAQPLDGRLGFEAAAAILPRPGGVVSGDSLRCRVLPGDRIALLLSDGMGSGGPAAVTSAAAVEHLLACLASGVGVERALAKTNEHILTDSAIERFATVELAVVHLRGGLLEWYGMGCPPGFLLHSRGVREWGGGGLPAGILAVPEIRSGKARLRAGDVLVLVSDGILDRYSGNSPAGPLASRARWAADWLRSWRLRPGGAREMAAGLLAAARARAVADHDDLAVLTCRLWSGADGGGGKAYGGATGIGGAGGTGVPPLAGR